MESAFHTVEHTPPGIRLDGRPATAVPMAGPGAFDGRPAAAVPVAGPGALDGLVIPATAVPMAAPGALDGLIPATVVPMAASGALDLPWLRRYLRWIAEQGPVALAVTADTGEVARLTHREQLQVVEVAKESSGLCCIAGLSGTSPAHAAARAEDLHRAGADALLIFPLPAPGDAHDAHDDAVVDYHRAVAQVGLPLIAFQLQPSLGGVLYRPDTLRRLLAVDGVVAIKEASFDRQRFRDVAAAVAEVGHVTLLTGNDNFILESFELGATGALLGFGAVLTASQVAMIEAWREGRTDQARALAARLQPLADAVFAHPVGDYRARLKECLVMLGVLPAGAAHVRPPGRAIDDDERARLQRALHQALRPAGAAGAAGAKVVPA